MNSIKSLGSVSITFGYSTDVSTGIIQTESDINILFRHLDF